MEQKNQKSPEYINYLKTRISESVPENIAELMLYYALSEEEHSKVLEEIREYCFRGKSPVDKSIARPKAYLVIAQTGAGKSNLSMKIKKDNPNVVAIDSDAFKTFNPYKDEIKQKYQQYFGHLTGLDAYIHRDEIYDEALSRGYDILIEIAPSTKELLFNIDFEELAKNNYDIEAYILSVSEENSLLSVHERYEGQIEAGMDAPKLTDLRRAKNSTEAVPIIIDDLLEKHKEVRLSLFKRADTSNVDAVELQEPIFVTDDKTDFKKVYFRVQKEDLEKTLAESDKRIEAIKEQMKRRDVPQLQVKQFNDICDLIENSKRCYSK